MSDLRFFEKNARETSDFHEKKSGLEIRRGSGPTPVARSGYGAS